jgi:hypothetical protein
LEFDGVQMRTNDTYKKVKEAWNKAQDSSDNSNGSQEREKP